jgi:hypothetical protein
MQSRLLLVWMGQTDSMYGPISTWLRGITMRRKFPELIDELDGLLGFKKLQLDFL